MPLPRLLRRLSALPDRLATPACRPARRVHRYRPGAEQLEDRCVPSAAAGLNVLLSSGALWTAGAAAPGAADPPGGGVADPSPPAPTNSSPPAPAATDPSPASFWSGMLSSGMSPSASASPPVAPAADPASDSTAVAPGLALTVSAWAAGQTGPDPATLTGAPSTGLGGSPGLGALLASTWDPSQGFSEVPPWVTGGYEMTNPFFLALPLSYQEQMYFNSADSYQTFVNNFQGVARSWWAQAQAQGLTDDAQLEAFFTQKLDAQFQATRGALAATYPGLTDTQYRALMAMNLADGYFVYGSQQAPTTSFATLLNFDVGSCGEIAELTTALCRLQGIDAQVVTIDADYPAAPGEFAGTHAVCQAAGLWLDAQTNIAFQMDPVSLMNIPPDQRLTTLLQNGQVYGFYNWYLNPSVRAEQLQRGLDGGSMAFFLYYYLGSLGQWNSVYSYGADWMPPVQGP